MYCSKSLALIGLALATPSATDAFVVTSPSRSSRHSALGATNDVNNERASSSDAIRNIAAASALTLGLLFPSADALAAPDTASQLPMHAFQSSSVEVSAQITTMDFSMPSSYDNIADPLASSTNKEELTNTEVINTAKGRAKKAVESGPSAKEQAAAARADRVAERKAKEVDQAAKDDVAAAERDANIKAAREAKIAARAEAKADKVAQAAADQEDAKFKDAKFVDTSMPTY